MKKSWKKRLIDAIDFAVIVMLLIFCSLGVFFSVAFVVSLIFGIEALTNLVLWLIAILSPPVVWGMLAFVARRRADNGRKAKDSDDNV